jgi:hypothetical protein
LSSFLILLILASTLECRMKGRSVGKRETGVVFWCRHLSDTAFIPRSGGEWWGVLKGLLREMALEMEMMRMPGSAC